LIPSYFFPMLGLLFCFFINSNTAFSQQKGSIFGIITDGNLKEPLGFAAIGIPSLNIGTTSDFEGKYNLTNIPVGSHQVEFSYLGYQSQTLEVQIEVNKAIQIDITLSEGGVLMEEVIIVGQAVGQRAAINNQINSNTIVNVVSKEKLQELPDQNAAESVGRLAGVSVYRDAGEGQQVSIRGISPRFNSITINGERLPSTEQETRSVDLSMISSDALEGIELFKAIRPDMDGDAIGGTVNFTIRKAAEGLKGNIRLLGGYNDLKKDFGQFRVSSSVSNRFLENKLGLILTANYQQSNRSNEFLNTSYEFTGNDPNTLEPILRLASLNLGDRLETRKRYGGSLTLDYDLGANHNLLFNSNISQLNRDDQQYRRRYRLSNNELRFTARQRDRSTFLIANALSGKHKLGNLSIDWRGSYSKSKQKTPFSLRGQFWELAATTTGVSNDKDLNTVPAVFKNNLDQTTLRDIRLTQDFVEEDRKTFNIDLKYDFNAGKNLNGFIKVGGKYRTVKRARDKNENFMRPYLLNNENPAGDFPATFLTTEAGQILLANFIGTYRNDGFFNGDFDILPGTETSRNQLSLPLDAIDIQAFNSLFKTNYNSGDALRYTGHIDQEKLNAFYAAYQDRAIVNSNVDLEDYDGQEDIYAAYAMTELNISKWLMLMGGLRFERTDQSYSSRSGSPLSEDEGGSGFIEFTDRNASQGYSDLLPMAHLRIKPIKWFDFRAAITKTLARPNFFNLVPWESINNSEQEINRGKPDLKHTTAWNYDAFLSFYNKFGLLTIGGFYKQLDNIDYIKSSAIVETGNIFNGYSLIEPANIIGTSDVKGVEIDLQANLRSLNGFWKGIIIGANITLAESKTFYPVFDVKTEFIPVAPFFVTTLIDTVRSGSIVGQANLIANLTLGYEIGGFSGRISAVHQTKSLSPGNPGIGRAASGVGRIPELDYFDDSFWRFDLALKQRIDKKGKFTFLLNINNITNTPERALLGTGDLLQEEEFFGFTADFGVLYKFRK
jgi:TonB-dependent receptor